MLNKKLIRLLILKNLLGKMPFVHPLDIMEFGVDRRMIGRTENLEKLIEIN
jgi:hypothetical protein